MKLVWRRKRPIKVSGRKVKEGEEFSVNDKTANLLKILGHAEDAPKVVHTYQRRDMRAAEPPLHVSVSPSASTYNNPLYSARAAYERKTGEKPDLRWGLARLKEELAKDAGA